jgi:hypothetical protein
LLLRFTSLILSMEAQRKTFLLSILINNNRYEQTPTVGKQKNELSFSTQKNEKLFL